MAREFVVVKRFKDLSSNNHIYNAGDFYPRKGAKLDEERANELASSENKRNEPLIVEMLTNDAIKAIKKDAKKEFETENKGKKKK